MNVGRSSEKALEDVVVIKLSVELPSNRGISVAHLHSQRDEGDSSDVTKRDKLTI